ncbi:CdaR family protein [Aquimarina sp. ERC-38]|uniref:CdaR family protein n=1 Tax=Aquimarina sp. ERC-38 TaxID=2949996 RepID=UPI0022472C7F|nr:CdaR family protein [Aquimarina sp. ERC-38]UZO79373.1 CdaR family protein [Aquimarina sp. ERC-38]
MKKKLHKLSFRRHNVKVFLFFLLFTSVLWVVIQFSKNYTQEIEVLLAYQNLPENEVIDISNSDQQLKLLLSGNGFRFINYLFDQPVVKMDIKEAISNESNTYEFKINKEDPDLKSQLNFKGNIINIQKDIVQVKTTTNTEKKVPIVVKTKIKYAPGYGTDQPISSSPDSILIRGPKRSLDTIRVLATELLTIRDLKSDFKGNLKIDISAIPDDIDISREFVTASIDVSKITEGNKEVPVQLINVPKNIQVTIFPKTVQVVYRINLDKIDDITASDFVVEADFSEAVVSSEFLVLNLKVVPKEVKDVRLMTNKIQYVIINSPEPKNN